MPLVFRVHLLNRIASLRELTRALSLFIITIGAGKGSFPASKLMPKSGKALGTRLTFTKIKEIPIDRPYSQTHGRVTTNELFLSPALQNKFHCSKKRLKSV